MHSFKWLRVYLDCEARGHLAVLGAVAMMGSIMVCADRFKQRTEAETEAARQWPMVEARVVSSHVSERNASDESSFGTLLGVTATFSYLVGDQPTQGEYVATWGRTDYRNWSEFLAPGKRIQIRVSPSDPKRVSLVDYTNIP